jgi:hypothetical protein
VIVRFSGKNYSVLLVASPNYYIYKPIGSNRIEEYSLYIA